MNLGELRTISRVKMGNPSVAEVPNATIDRLINESGEEIQEKYVFLKGRRIVTFPTVLGSPLYDIPADCLAVYSIWNTTTGYQRKLIKRDENWLSAQQTLQNGPPTDYVRQRGWIQLVATPDNVYTMRLTYRASYTQLVADTDVPVIPTSWCPGIWRLAVFNYWNEKGDLAKAQWWNNIWLQWVSDKPNEVQEEYQMDDTEGVTLPFLIRSQGQDTSHSQNLWDREP